MSDSLHTETATAERYWVVGGNYETMEFDRVVPGTEDVFGPFGSIQDAESVWRCMAEKTRYQATVRYTIAAEQTCMSQASYRPVIYAAVGEAAPSPTPQASRSGCQFTFAQANYADFTRHTWANERA